MISIIPKPLELEVSNCNKLFLINSNTTVSVNNNYKAFAEFNNFLAKAFGYTIKEDDKGNIIFKIEKNLEKTLGKEGYQLSIKANSIEIKAPYENGIFYGIESLKQIIVNNIGIDSAEIPQLYIEDKPLYKHRGYMLDVCRHFFDVSEVLKVIDVLAIYKINVLHLHLTEDQGWRIQIDKYPKLTTIGARRKETIGDGKRHGGYYTKDDIKKIVDYCSNRFITVIPEIDLPGHSMAAAAAYNYLTCKGEPIEVSTTFGVKPDIFCAGKDSTFEFLYGVLDELIEMFPGEYIHLGGDEAPKERWQECPMCQKAIKDNNLNSVEELQGYFLNKLVDYLKQKGKKVICWNESIYSKILDKSVVCQYWSDGKKPERVINEINNGRTGIISKFTPYYFDYPFAMHSVKKVYNFVPELEGIKKQENIMGIESPLWTEYVGDFSRIEYMTNPRLAAVSEIAWTDKVFRDYEDFMKRLPYNLKILDIYNVRYAPLKDINPRPLKAFRQMIQFAKLMFTKENIKTIRASAKAAKSVKSEREK